MVFSRARETSRGEVKVKREVAIQQSGSEAVRSRQKSGSGGVVASVSIFGFQFKERCMRNRGSSEDLL